MCEVTLCVREWVEQHDVIQGQFILNLDDISKCTDSERSYIDSYFGCSVSVRHLFMMCSLSVGDEEHFLRYYFRENEFNLNDL